MNSLYFAFCHDDLLLVRLPDGTYTVPSGSEPPTALKAWTHVLDVNSPGGWKVKTYALDNIPDIVLHKDSKNLTPGTLSYEMCPLRQSYYKLSYSLYLTAGKCHELLYWDMNTRFCGVCGGQMRMSTEISKKCTECGKEIWPQLAPAVIVRIAREDKILMVRARNFRGDFYGLVAGFVETGETLEEAVVRETQEETGLSIKNIKYFGSQPWPYPSGLMVGFTADYAGGEIHLQRSELSTAAWFDKNHLPQLPEKLSIARMLVDDWLNQE